MQFLRQNNAARFVLGHNNAARFGPRMKHGSQICIWTTFGRVGPNLALAVPFSLRTSNILSPRTKSGSQIWQSTITGLDWWTGVTGPVDWTGGLMFFALKITFMLSKQTYLPAMPCIVAWCTTITQQQAFSLHRLGHNVKIRLQPRTLHCCASCEHDQKFTERITSNKTHSFEATSNNAAARYVERN